MPVEIIAVILWSYKPFPNGLVFNPYMKKERLHKWKIIELTENWSNPPLLDTLGIDVLLKFWNRCPAVRFDSKIRFSCRPWGNWNSPKCSSTKSHTTLDAAWLADWPEVLYWKQTKYLRMLFFIVLPLPPVANRFSSPVMDTVIIIINHIFWVVFACYVVYKTDI